MREQQPHAILAGFQSQDGSPNCHGQTCSGHLDKGGTVVTYRDRRDEPGDDIKLSMGRGARLRRERRRDIARLGEIAPPDFA
jgi:hypothetical protein